MKLGDVLLTFFDAVRIIQEMAAEAHRGNLVDLEEVGKLLEEVERAKVPVAEKRAKRAKKNEEKAPGKIGEIGASAGPKPISFTMELVRLEDIPEWMAELLPNSWN